MKIHWVARNRPLGAIPFITGEKDLPSGQRVLVFLPHADDGCSGRALLREDRLKFPLSPYGPRLWRRMESAPRSLSGDAAQRGGE